MKPRFYVLFEDCIEQGLERGYNRAHKHTDNPTKEIMLREMYPAVTAAFHEYFTFEGDTDEVV